MTIHLPRTPLWHSGGKKGGGSPAPSGSRAKKRRKLAYTKTTKPAQPRCKVVLRYVGLSMKFHEGDRGIRKMDLEDASR